MEDVIRREHPELVLHLGDLCRDIEEIQRRFPQQTIQNVCGNCDGFTETPDQRILRVEGKRILMMHGHRYNVKLTYASAAYAARWVAKNVVAAGLARRCQVQLAYAIGVARPVSIRVDTFGTGSVSDGALEQAVERVFDLRPSAIIRRLDLRRPIYRQRAAYGHFGRGHHRHAGRERRLAGHLQSAEQSLRRCTIPLDILVYRRTRFDAVRTLLRDHLPSDDPLTNPAVRFGHAVEKVSSPCAPRDQKAAETFVLHVVRRTGHRNRQHGLVPDAAGCIELPDRNDNGAACESLPGVDSGFGSI